MELRRQIGEQWNPVWSALAEIILEMKSGARDQHQAQRGPLATDVKVGALQGTGPDALVWRSQLGDLVI